MAFSFGPTPRRYGGRRYSSRRGGAVGAGISNTLLPGSVALPPTGGTGAPPKTVTTTAGSQTGDPNYNPGDVANGKTYTANDVFLIPRTVTDAKGIQHTAVYIVTKDTLSTVGQLADGQKALAPGWTTVVGPGATYSGVPASEFITQAGKPQGEDATKAGLNSPKDTAPVTPTPVTGPVGPKVVTPPATTTAPQVDAALIESIRAAGGFQGNDGIWHPVKFDPSNDRGYVDPKTGRNTEAPASPGGPVQEGDPLSSPQIPWAHLSPEQIGALAPLIFARDSVAPQERLGYEGAGRIEPAAPAAPAPAAPAAAPAAPDSTDGGRFSPSDDRGYTDMPTAPSASESGGGGGPTVAEVIAAGEAYTPPAAPAAPEMPAAPSSVGGVGEWMGQGYDDRGWTGPTAPSAEPAADPWEGMYDDRGWF